MINKKDEFYTLKNDNSIRIPVGACRFTAMAFSITNYKEAQKKLEDIRYNYPDATHHVCAFRVFQGEELLEKSSDDREPAGSAGKPVMEVLRRNQLVNTQIIVVRYFGGVKLGIGGLIRAYRLSAKEVVKTVNFLPLREVKYLTATVPYQLLGEVLKLIYSLNGEIIETKYDQNATVIFLLDKEHLSQFKDAFQNCTRGQGTFTIGGVNV